MTDHETRPQGGCQCGRIRYRLLGEPLTLYLCHCRDCQKQSSSAFGMSLWVHRRDIEFRGGTPRIWKTAGESGAPKLCAFCPECGSRLYHASADEQAPLSLKAGSLDDTSWLRPVAHLWTRRAQPWLPLEATGMRCYEGEPDSDESLLALWREARR